MAIPMAVPMAIQRVEVITGVERRRQFSDEEKLRLVEEAFQPGAKATAVARRLGVDVSLLYRWRRQFFGPQPRLPAFLAITVATGGGMQPCRRRNRRSRPTISTPGCAFTRQAQRRKRRAAGRTVGAGSVGSAGTRAKTCGVDQAGLVTPEW